MTIFSNKELALKLENSVASYKIEFISTQNKLNNNDLSTYKKFGSGYAIFANGYPSISVALGLGLTGKVYEDEIIRLEGFFKENKSSVKIDVSHLADMSLTQILMNRGYRISDYTTMLIKPLSGKDIYKEPADNHIQQVSEDNIDVFAKTVTKGFLENSDASDSSIYTKEVIDSSDNISKIFFHQPNTACFTAYRNNEPVGGGGMVINKDTVFFIGTSTLPEYRNLGIQTDLLKRRLNYSIFKGCNLAMTITFPGSVSQHNVEKLGFQVVYGRIIFTKDFL